MTDLVTKLDAIIRAMEGLGDLKKLISDLARIERQEEDLESLVKAVYRKRVEEALRGKD